MHYVVEPVRIYTTLVLDALECLHRHDQDHLQITPIAIEYNLWYTYLT